MKAVKKALRVAAPNSGNVPVLPAGCEFDTLAIGVYDFAIVVAKNLQGITELCKSDDTLAARLFNRALRIDVPAKLDARKQMDSCKTDAEREKVALSLQDSIFSFNLAEIRPRAARTPKSVKLDPAKKKYTDAEVQALLQNAGIKVVTA